MHTYLRSLLTLALVATAITAQASAETPKPVVEKIEVGIEQSAPQSVVKPRLTAEEQALQAIRDAGREAVAVLVARLPGQATEQGRAEIQKQIEATKQASRVEMLRKLIEFADAKGDVAQATEARRILDIALNGPQSQSLSVNRPAPTQNPGGQR